ncbi:MAG: hypothetical protein LBH39_02965, partial [Clostridiales Family XIII bacterium]|nr:hypothetical protein [Clostridiales Family XIII bacterium]
AGTSKPYCREFNEYVENGGENMIVLTSYMENTDSLYAQFERQIGAYMLNMSFAKDYASHIKGRIVDSSARAIPSAALDLEIEIESIILNTDGSERPAGTFTETQTAHYDVTGGTYDWNVLPSKQPEFPDAGYDITASADGRYSATKNVKVGFYQETQDGVDFVLPEAITSSFNFNSRPAKDAPVTIPFTTYALAGGSSSPGVAGVVSVTVDGAPATVVSQGNGEYIAQFTPTAEGKSEVVIDFAGGPEHSALVRTLDVVDLSVPKAQVRFSGPTAVAPGAESEYILSVANAPNLANAVITFEVDGRYMTPKKAEAVATSFPLLGDVEWVKLPGDKYQGKAILWSDSRNIDATASTDILKLTFEAGQVLGSGSVKVTGISMANLIYSGNNPPTGSAFIPAEFTGSDSITVAIGPIPSKYDIDNNGVIDQRDLARAQYYYKVRVGDIRWNQSGHIGYRADVNGDGVVDILDFIEILANIA